MTTTPAVSAANHQRFASLVLAVAITLGIGATSCGTKVGATKKDVVTTTSSSTPQGYSYDHDSRINESP